MIKENKTIVGAIIIAIIIACISIISISNVKAKKVSADYKKNIINQEEIKVNEQDNDIIYVEINELEEQNIIEENVENTQKNETTDNNKQVNTPTYYIKVNYGAQVVTIYTKDSEGNYTVPVKAMVCSTGTYTPKSGVYKITSYRREWNGLQGNVYGKYATQIVGNILFHSVPYLTKGDSGSLEYWEYDKLGTYASAGCIRLTVKDAKWIFDNCASGTKVEFYSSSNPGPLGKPTAQKISNAPGDLKNWDPTDPNPNNPWKNYKPEEGENTNTEDNTQTNEIANEIDTNTETNEIANEVDTNTETNEIANEVETNTEANEVVNEVDTNTELNEVVKEVENNIELNETKTDDETNE